MFNLILMFWCISVWKQFKNYLHLYITLIFCVWNEPHWQHHQFIQCEIFNGNKSECLILFTRSPICNHSKLDHRKSQMKNTKGMKIADNETAGLKRADNGTAGLKMADNGTAGVVKSVVHATNPCRCMYGKLNCIQNSARFVPWGPVSGSWQRWRS